MARILVSILSVLLIGCGGTRTTGKKRIDIKADSLKIDNNIVLSQNNAFYDVLTLKPIDNTKPIILNGISYYNTAITFDKSKFENLEYKDLSKLSYDSVEKTEVEKETYRKDDTIKIVSIVLGVVLIIGVLLTIIYLIRTYFPKIKLL